ncbi:MAG: cupin domain-containing protein [Candidatus Thorarchaeota archaeon]|jgi:mannose-6-phosphate isomerase-like protein (cupin superfamily)
MDWNLVQKWQDLSWESTRPDITIGGLAHRLIPDGSTVHGVMLTKVEPEGEFSIHADEYDHVFLFLEGMGEGWLGDDSYEIEPGLLVRVPAGQSHGYRNTNNSDLILLTINYSDS